MKTKKPLRIFYQADDCFIIDGLRYNTRQGVENLVQGLAINRNGSRPDKIELYMVGKDWDELKKQDCSRWKKILDDKLNTKYIPSGCGLVFSK